MCLFDGRGHAGEGRLNSLKKAKGGWKRAPKKRGSFKKGPPKKSVTLFKALKKSGSKERKAFFFNGFEKIRPLKPLRPR